MGDGRVTSFFVASNETYVFNLAEEESDSVKWYEWAYRPDPLALIL